MQKNINRYIQIPEVINWKQKHKYLLWMNFSLKWLLLNKLTILGNKLYKLSVNERVIDYPFVFSNIGDNEKFRILDVGCCGSKLSIELASLGHEVYGIDVIDYSLTHPNFHFLKNDVMKMSFPDNFFDVITCISTIEHIGLGRYGDILSNVGDKKALTEIKRVLKHGGKLILTTPFGKKSICYYKGIAIHKIYDYETIIKLISGFTIEKMIFMVKVGECWIQSSWQETEKIDGSNCPEVQGDALFILSKPQTQNMKHCIVRGYAREISIEDQ